MIYTYSKHILTRIKERNITLDEIEEVLLERVETITIQSKKDKDVDLILGYVNGKGIAVIVNRLTGVLITVRRMRDNEEKLF